MKKIWMIFLSVLQICSLSGCGKMQQKETQAGTFGAENIEISTVQETLAEKENIKMKLYFDTTEIPVIWENCKTIDELREEAEKGDIVVNMSMYGGWEQVGSLGRSYTNADHQMNAVSGDIVLYNGNQIVVFYGSNSWSYTKLGKMDLSQDTLEELLSRGDITLTIRKD